MNVERVGVNVLLLENCNPQKSQISFSEVRPIDPEISQFHFVNTSLEEGAFNDTDISAFRLLEHNQERVDVEALLEAV